MRRILTTVLASSLLALAIPAAASAHHGSRHRHHRRHHAHTVVFIAYGASLGHPEQPADHQPVGRTGRDRRLV